VSYDNAVRYAVRTLRNPTKVGVDVVQYKDHIALRVNNDEVERLETPVKLSFLAYVAELATIIEEHGGVLVGFERVIDGKVRRL
jgi:hypothetical protein